MTDEQIARPDSRAGGIIDDVGWNSHVRQAHGEGAHGKLHAPHRIEMNCFCLEDLVDQLIDGLGIDGTENLPIFFEDC